MTVIVIYVMLECYKVIILTKLISYLKQKKQSIDSCVILKMHYSKSALYMSIRVPFSLFSVPWFF